jgi:hypothetical protein
MKAETLTIFLVPRIEPRASHMLSTLACSTTELRYIIFLNHSIFSTLNNTCPQKVFNWFDE